MPPTHADSGLTDVELDMLEFERAWFKYAGAKETQVHDRFGISSVRYYQQLKALIDRPEAMAADPMLVRRLLRLRERQRLHRSTGSRSSARQDH
ncbi:MAG: hypothetical protein CMH83_21735 [Nocardioides sp.]|nr:hypothetical protein [Nocardioides sp.]